MSVFKCKMCGGDLNIEEGISVVECEFCGSRQTVPTADNEKKMGLFARAEHLRFANEFDKAAAIYEQIVAEFPIEAEAYWGLFLCKYGIEYVDDPATGKKIPTCHRSSFESAMDDPNLELACDNADGVARRQYREEAKAIEGLRSRIIEVSSKEEPYDIFISYKDRDENNDRTIDSVIAQDVYDALTEKGYRVFFSRISLENKLGTEYEPYIFAALNSAKVMLVFGTDYENFNAVWVKNEWSRFLALIAAGQKKVLIPCYKDIDAYDMPKEFKKLSAQDMGKVGAMQDLIRGVEKVLGKNGEQSTVPVQNIAPAQITMVDNRNEAANKRGYLALEDGEWENADRFFEDALNYDPEDARAYLGKLLAKRRCHKAEDLKTSEEVFENDRDFRKTIRFADDVLKDELLSYDKANREYITQKEEERQRQKAEEARRRAEAEEKKRKEEAQKREAFKKILMPIGNNAGDYISAGSYHTVGLKSDGKVVVAKDLIEHYSGQCDVSNWKDIIAISAELFHTVGLKSDGTVVATKYTGDGYYANKGQCDVSSWKDIVAISAGIAHTVGVKADGTVVATKYTGNNYSGQCDVSSWKDIVAVSAGNRHTVGLKADGTVVAVGSHDNDRCNVSGWKDIVAISAGDNHTVGLKSDGTVIAVGSNYNGQCDVSGWKDIVAISAGQNHTVGLKSDGTVVANKYIRRTLFTYEDQCDVSNWEDIVAVSAGEAHTVGLKADGTVVAVGRKYIGLCDVSGWKLFNGIDDIQNHVRRKTDWVEAARKSAAARKESTRKARIAELKEEKKTREQRKVSLEKEIPTLTGMFKAGKRRDAEAEITRINKRLAEIEEELNKLGE